jgi:hypothetical protein
MRHLPPVLALALAALACKGLDHDPLPPLRISWDKDVLTVQGGRLGGRALKIWYLEAYCRPDSTTNDWVRHTVIRHRTERVSTNAAATEIRLRCHLEDGVVVDHRIRAGRDDVDFQVRVHNPTATVSQAHWAQPCIRVGEFTGLHDPAKSETYDYLRKSFVFLDGRLERMPTPGWATEARYTPGQVWAAPGVPRSDVNPRPLNPLTPSNGLIGCFSADDRSILATAWDPYQELFQGVITCLHSDFRIGGVKPGETKRIHGKLYLVPNDVPALLARYGREFSTAGARAR